MKRLNIVLAILIAFFLTNHAIGALGTKEDPLPIGTTLDTGDYWEITVLDVLPNADELIANENKYNTQPDVENQFFMARIKVKNIGPIAQKFNDYSLNAVGDSSDVYTHSKSEVIPDPLDMIDLLPGEEQVGNTFWEVKSKDADSLVMYYKYAKPYLFMSLGNSPDDEIDIDDNLEEYYS
jgi:hypothetical protein